MVVIYLDGISTVKSLKKRYESAHKHKANRTSLLPQGSGKMLKTHGNENSQSKSRKSLSKKHGSVKSKTSTKKSGRGYNSKTEYLLKASEELHSHLQLELTQSKDVEVKDQPEASSIKNALTTQNSQNQMLLRRSNSQNSYKRNSMPEAQYLSTSKEDQVG